MIRKIAVLNLLVFSCLIRLTALEDVSGPTNPVVDDIQIPDVKLSNPAPTTTSLLSVRVIVEISGGKQLRGMLLLTNPTLFWQTNVSEGSLSVRNWTVEQLGEIDILKWRPDRTDKDTVLWEPFSYRMTGETDAAFLHEGRIPELDRLVVDTGDRRVAAFTIFYDRWIEGKKGVFRWENARNANFQYHRENPVEGVAVKIKFPDHVPGGEN